MGRFSYKIHKSGNDTLLAICDREILGESFNSPEQDITIDKDFYSHDFADEKTILKKSRKPRL